MSLRIINLLCLLLVVGPAAAEPVATLGDWAVYRDEDMGTAVTVAASGERLGLLCQEEMEECVYFLRLQQPCADGQRQPVWLDGEADRQRLQGLCTEALGKFLLLFDEGLGELIARSPVVEVAVARPDGGRRTLRFSTAGAVEAIRQAREEQMERRRLRGFEAQGKRA